MGKEISIVFLVNTVRYFYRKKDRRHSSSL